jgi:hypothetical protein
MMTTFFYCVSLLGTLSREVQISNNEVISDNPAVGNFSPSLDVFMNYGGIE